MKRLTFKNEDGTFGVVGMNEQNQEQLLYICVKKLLDYEETGLSPDGIDLLLEAKYCRDDFIKEIRKKVCNEVFDLGLSHCIDGVHGKFISFESLDKIKRGTK